MRSEERAASPGREARLVRWMPRFLRLSPHIWLVGGAVVVLLAILWFPFDWLSTVWPVFGVPFRQVFRTAHDHFVGHTIFFFVVGFLIQAVVPAWRRRPQWYFPGLVVAALMQETIQALFRGQMPAYTDANAFKGDALGGTSAFLLLLLLSLPRRATSPQS